MANQDYFALLLAGLDAQQSAAEINQQLNSPEFKQALEQIKIDFKLDENAFAGLMDAMKNGFTFASKIKDELEMAQGYFLSMQKPTVTKTPGFSYEEDLMFKEAQKIAPGMDISVVSKSIDAITGATTKMKFAYKDAEDAVSSFSITLDDSTGAYEFIPSTIKTTSAMSVKLKEAEQDFKKLNTTYKNLKAEEFKFGPTPETTAQLAKVEDETNAIYQNLQTIAKQSNFLPPEQIAPTLAIIEKMLNRTTEFRTEYAKSLDISNEQKAGISALKDYKKLVDEISVLEAKQSVQGADFSMVDKLALNRLKEQKILLEETFAPFSQLTEKAREYDKLIAGQQKWDIAEEEIKRGVTLTSQLSKEYEKLNKNTLEIGKAGLKKSTEANIPALEQERAVLLKNIAAYEDQIRLLNQSPEGLQNAQKLLSQAQQIAQDELTKTNNLLIAQQKIKEEAQSAFMGTQGGGTTAVDFSTMSEKISLTNTHLNKFAQELYNANATVKSATTITDDYGRELVELEIIQNKHADTLDIVKVRLDTVSQSYGILDNYTQKNVSRSMAFTEQIGHAIKKMATWGIAARLLYGSMRQLQEGFEFIKDIDKDITQAAIVTGKQRSEVQGLAQDYAELGLAMGKTVKEIADVNTELLRQGLTIQESGRRLDTIIKLSATGQITTEESMRVVTTAVNAMQESHIKAADVLLRASNISASSVEQLGEAFTKTASSAHATGMTIEETTGILATMLEVTQEGPSQLGTSLKTILARFTRVNEETGEFNDELNDVQNAVESVGVSFLDADGQIRSVYAILEDLSEIWPTLTKNQQAYIATTGAGVRMQNRFFAVMENFDRVKTITEESGKAAGTTEDAYMTYLNSVEAASNRTQAALESFWINSIQAEHVTMFYDAITALINLVDKIGALNVAIMVGMGWFVKTTGIIKTLTQVFALFIAKLVVARQASMAMIGPMNMLGTSADKAAASVAAAGSAVMEATKAQTAGIAATKGLSTVFLKSILPMMAAVAAIGAVTAGLMKMADNARKAREEQAKLAEEIATSNNKFVEQTKNYDLTILQLSEMGKKYQEYLSIIRSKGGSAASALGTEKYAEFIQLQEEMLNLAPGLKIYTDQYGNSVLTLGSHANFAAEAFRELYKEDAKRFAENFSKQFEENIATTEEFTKSLELLNKAKEGLEYQQSTLSGIDPVNYTDAQKKNLEEAQNLVNKAQKDFDKEYDKQTQKIKTLLAQYTLIDTQLTDIQKRYLQNPVIVQWFADFGGELSEEDFKTKIEGLLIELQESLPDNFEFNIDIGIKNLAELNQQHEDGVITGKRYTEMVSAVNKSMTDQFVAAREASKGNQAAIDTINELENAFKGSIKQIDNQGFSYSQLNSIAKNSVDRMTMLVDAQKELKEQGYLSTNTLKMLSEAFGTAEIAAQLATGSLDGFLEKEKALIKSQIANTKELIRQTEARVAATLIEMTAYDAARSGYNQALEDFEQKPVGGTLGLRISKNINNQTSDMKAQIALLNNLLKELEGIETGDSGGGAGSKATKDTLAQADAYQKYTIALEDNSNALARNQSLQGQEDLALEERLKLMQEEIDLNNERQELLHQLNQARRAERDTFAISLMKQGFKIIGEGDKQRIENLENIQGKSEKIEEQFKRFIELQTSLIPEASDEWWQLENAIAGTTKSMQELISEAKDAEIARRIEEANKAYEEQQDRLAALEDIQSELVEFIRKRGEIEREELEKTQKLEMDALEETYNARKQAYEDDLDEFEKLINGRIKALQDESAAEDYAKNLQSKRDEANELQRQIDVLALDTSLTAQKKVIELREQQAAINEEIATMQQDKERELIIDSLEAQLDEYQSQTENKINLIDEEYKAEKTALEKMQDIEKGILEERYADAKIYSEARQALIDGEVQTYEGHMISIKDALREMAEESGEIFGILGNTIEEELIQKLEDARRAIEEITSGNLLSKPDEEAITKEVEQEFSRPPEFRDLTNAEWRRYLRNKRRWTEAFEEGRDKNTDPDMLGWAAENAKIRKDYGINSDRYSYEDLVNWSGYADGGKNIRPGLAMLHGTQNDPEWIFNDDQFQETLKRSIGAALHFSLPKIDSNYTKDEIEVKIGTLVNIEGNADRTAIPLIKNASAELAERLKIELAKIGVERAAF